MSKLTGKGAPETSLPKPAESAARFHHDRGIDQGHKTFEYTDGKLHRDGVLIADFAAMQPEPKKPPHWARTW